MVVEKSKHPKLYLIGHKDLLTDYVMGTSYVINISTKFSVDTDLPDPLMIGGIDLLVVV